MSMMSMRASLEIFNIFTFLNCYFLLYSVGTSDTLSQKHIYFQVSNYICMQFPFITYGMALYRLNTNIVKIYVYASERRNSGIFTY